MNALDRKLLRDGTRMKAQVVTIALVVACGIASHVTISGTRASLLYARDSYYERYRFADVFAHLERAPEALASRIQAIRGVALVQTRVVDALSFPLPDLAEPASGYLVSLPSHGAPGLGAVALREGRMVVPGRADEAVVLEAFARAHGLHLGGRLPAVMSGIRRELRVVGIALAPEFVFSVAPGAMLPDPRRFGVVWMDRAVASAAFQMTGAFNDVLLRLQPKASERAVVSDLNRLLEPYGGQGAYGRDRQLSNNALRGELAQLETLTRVMPLIFLGVAAFLINVVLSRLVQLQRTQIAVLRAVGYSRYQVGLHYLKLVVLIVLLGAAIGIPFGAWMGGLMTDLYTEYFHFESLQYRLNVRVLTFGLGTSLLAAVVGALSAVSAVMRLPPAEAMRPEPPMAYRRGLAGRMHLRGFFGHAAALIVRELERRPLRAFLSVLGIALGVAVLVSGRFGYDAIEWFMQVQFNMSQREDLNVTFRRAVPVAALHELEHLPGVLRVEGLRMLAVRYRSGHVARESVLIGHPAQAQLRRVLSEQGVAFEPPDHGIVLTQTLARILGLRLGDEVMVDVLEGQRGHYPVRVVGLVDEVFGLLGHMQADSLGRLLGEQPRVSAALLIVDPKYEAGLRRALKERPEVWVSCAATR